MIIWSEGSKAEMRKNTNVRWKKYNILPPKERMNEEKPIEPLHRMFFIPANSSSSAFIQALADNFFTGVIFETEADTLANTFKQEWEISAMCCGRLFTTRARVFSGGKIRSLLILRIHTWPSRFPELRGSAEYDAGYREWSLQPFSCIMHSRMTAALRIPSFRTGRSIILNFSKRKAGGFSSFTAS